MASAALKSTGSVRGDGCSSVHPATTKKTSAEIEVRIDCTRGPWRHPVRVEEPRQYRSILFSFPADSMPIIRIVGWLRTVKGLSASDSARSPSIFLQRCLNGFSQWIGFGSTRLESTCRVSPQPNQVRVRFLPRSHRLKARIPTLPAIAPTQSRANRAIRVKALLGSAPARRLSRALTKKM